MEMKMMRCKSRGRLSLKGGGDDTARPTDDASSTPPSPPSGPMTRARAKAIYDKVNSFLSMHYLDPTLDGSLPHSNALCVLSYVPQDRLQGCTEDGLKTGRQDEEEGEEKKSGGRIIRPGYFKYPPPPKSHPARASGQGPDNSNIRAG